MRCPLTYADVAELADAPDLGSGVPDVQVQVLSPAVKDVDFIGIFFAFLSEENRVV